MNESVLNKTVTLNNGHKMPILGFGTALVSRKMPLIYKIAIFGRLQTKVAQLT